jgi:hypothetical protein
MLRLSVNAQLQAGLAENFTEAMHIEFAGVNYPLVNS